MRPAAPRIQDVARRAGVATGTVSNVLNQPQKVTESTRRRVEEAIVELGFVRNSVARALVSGRTDTVGLVLTDLANSLFVDIARGAEAAAGEEGLSILIANSDVDQTKQTGYLVRFEQARVAGVLLAPLDGPLEAARAARRRHLPVVLVNAPTLEDDLCSVRVDEEGGGHLAARHLLEQGATRLVYLAGHPELSAIRRRLAGARRAVEEAGAGLRVVDADGLGIDVGRTVGRRLLTASEPVDGVLCPSDNLAVGVIQAATALGLTVPDDLLVVGYDDNHLAAESRVPISSVRQPGFEMGRQALALLVDEIRTGSEHQHRSITLDPHLVTRRSSVPTS